MNLLLALALFLVAYMSTLLLAIGIHDHFRVKKIIREQKVADARKAARTPEQIKEDARDACIALCGFDPSMLETK